MTLAQRDKKHLWHLLTQHKTHPDFIAIDRAQGVYLYDEAGNTYIDGISSWYTAVYGHCHPHITKKLINQVQQLDHVIFTGFTHEPAIALSEALIRILPSNQNKIFFSDNGSTAVEVGIKLALQYHHNLGYHKPVLVAFEEGFHGDTFGAMSVSGLSVYNGPFKDFFIEVKRIPTPNGINNKEVCTLLESILSLHNVAGFIYEPLIQCAAGMKIHDSKGLEELLRICKVYNVITIADEVFTGFGKTEKYFASEYMLNKPDIMCLSKALTAGMLPMGATSCTQKIYEGFYSEDQSKGFFHAHTYTANPLACAVALAGIELLTSEEIREARLQITKTYKSFAIQISNHPKVKSTRILGNVFALDINQNMERYGQQRGKLLKYFMQQGVFLRPLGNTIYTIPPYIIEPKELQKILESIEGVLNLV